MHINTPPNNHTRRQTNSKQKRKPLPIVVRIVYDRLYDVGAYHRRRAIGQAKETKEHVVEPGWGEFGHHGLGEGVVGGLEEAKHDVIGPANV